MSIAARFAIVASHDAGSRSTSMRSAACHALHERLLRSFLGQVVAAEHPVCHRVDEPSVLAIHRAYRAGFAAPEGVEHGRIHEYQRYDGHTALRR